MTRHSLIAALFVFSGLAVQPSFANTAKTDVKTRVAADENGPLTILGLSLGMHSEEALALLAAAEFQVVAPDTQSLSARKRNSKNLHYNHKNGEEITLEYAGKERLVTTIRYFIGDDVDAAKRMETRLRSRYGAPITRYVLSESSQLLIWEKVSPEQSRDFGPMTTIALTTGLKASLSFSQFTGARLAAPKRANIAANPLKDTAKTKPLSSVSAALPASPVD